MSAGPVSDGIAASAGALAAPLRFAANLSFLYPELAFADRFAAAAADGFSGIECLLPYELPADEFGRRVREHGLRAVLVNAPPGPGGAATAAADWAAGWRGLAALPGQGPAFERAFDAGIADALRWAAVADVPRIHVLAGVLTDMSMARDWRRRYVRRLRRAARAAAAEGRVLTIEPINPRDMPGYPLTRQQQAHALLDHIGEPNVQVQMDLYHCQIVEGDVTMRLRRWLPTGRVGHVQIAGVPDRNEPDRGELSLPHLLQTLAALTGPGWDGWIGCEYRPRAGGQPGGTRAGLGWMRRAR